MAKNGLQGAKVGGERDGKNRPARFGRAGDARRHPAVRQSWRAEFPAPQRSSGKEKLSP
jgi:hypothetical protein